MTDATDLWAAVVSRYDTPTLISLTNVQDRSATTADATVGTAAAQSVIDLWPIYAQVDYDSSDSTHVEVAVFGVIAILWRRGGTAGEAAAVRWEEVFGAEGMVIRLKRTGPRGRSAPSTNSGVTQSAETSSGRSIRPWSDTASIPDGLLPSDRTVDY